jgi:hypothetical protein
LKVGTDTRSLQTESARFTAGAAGKPEAAEGRSIFAEPAATLEISGAARADEMASPEDKGPGDKSGKLTRRLVTASFQGEVQAIISEAYENLSDWIKAAMSGGENTGKAFAAIRRLNRLIQRCMRKIGDLDKEDVLRQKQVRAEKKQEQLRAKQIQAELNKRLYERRKREQGYLRDAREMDGVEKIPGMGLTPAQLQAQLSAAAQALAQLSAPPPPAPAGGEASFAGFGGGEIAETAEVAS